MPVLDETPLGLPLPHPDNDPRNVDVPRLREALTTIDELLAAVITEAAVRAIAKATVDQVVGAAPGALDTLDELAQALGDDPNFATTVTNALAAKANSANAALTGSPTAPTVATTSANMSSNLIATMSAVRNMLGNASVFGIAVRVPTRSLGDAGSDAANTAFVQRESDSRGDEAWWLAVTQ